jgi:O-antigen ligase
MNGLPRRVKVLYFVLMGATGLLPLVPDEISFFSVLFACSFGLWFLVALPVRTRGKEPASRKVSIALALFFCCIAVSLPVALSNGVPLEEWARGALPFCFLLVYLVFPVLTAADGRFILGSLLFAVLCWLIKNLGRSLGDFLGGEASRITSLNADFGTPFALVGLPLLLFFASRRRPLTSAAFAFALVLLVIATGYRSQAILAVLLWLAFVGWQKPRLRLGLGAVTFVIAAVSVASLAGSSFSSEYLARFQDFEAEATSSRAVEALYAVQKFRESPLLGKGLGYPIPAAINRFGSTDPAPPNQPDHVGYIHNLWLYLCMDLGIAGLLAYAAVFGLAVYAGLARRKEDVQLAAAATVLTLLLYCTVEAAFRVIQINLVLGALAAVLAKSSRRTD